MPAVTVWQCYRKEESFMVWQQSQFGKATGRQCFMVWQQSQFDKATTRIVFHAIMVWQQSQFGKAIGRQCFVVWQQSQFGYATERKKVSWYGSSHSLAKLQGERVFRGMAVVTVWQGDRKEECFMVCQLPAVTV